MKRKSLSIAVQMALASFVAVNASSAFADYAVGVDASSDAAVYAGSGSAQAASAAATDYESDTTGWPGVGSPASVSPLATTSATVDPSMGATANETSASNSIPDSVSQSGGSQAYAVTDSENNSTYDSINNPLADIRTDAVQENDIPASILGTSLTATTDAVADIAASAGYDGLNNAAALAAASASSLATSRIANFEISSDGSAISLISIADSYARATAYAYANDADDQWVSAAAAAAAASATAQISGNNLTNSNSIGEVSIGIDLVARAAADAYASATATGDSGLDDSSVTAHSASYAESLVLDNVITNSGNIEASDSGIRLHAYADWDVDQQSETNSAKTEVSGNDITNSGSIVVTNAVWGAGIDVRAVTGFYNAPLDADAFVRNNNITNTGMIAVSGLTLSSLESDYAGFGADGIRLRAYGNEIGVDSNAVVSGNYIANTGRIYAEDDAIELSSVHSNYVDSLVADNTIENTYGGRIVARDVGISIFSNGNVSGNTIRNSGLIVSDTGMSLDGMTLNKSDRADFDNINPIGTAVLVRSYDDNHADNNALVLNAPAYLAGTILLDKNADVEVALNSGASHSVRWAIQRDPGYTGYTGISNDVTFGQQDQGSDYTWVGGSTTRAVLGGPLPWFVNEGVNDINGQRNDVYATIDPSAFAASANMLADLSGMVSTMAKTGMSRTADKDGFWIAGHGARMNYDGNNSATTDQDTRLNGGSIGYTHHFDAARVGVMAGYSDADLQVGSFYNDIYNHSYSNQAKGGFAGIYVNGDIGWLNVNAGFSGGRLNHDDKRFVNDNLKWWGISYATASYDSTWYSPEVTLAVPFETAGGLTVTPSVHLQYTKQNIDSYTEKGSDSNAHVSGRDIAVSEAKVGLDITKTVGMASFTGRVGYLTRNSHGDDSVNVTMIGDTHEVSFFNKDINAAYVGAALNLELGERVDFNLSGNYLTGGDIASSGNVTGMIRFKY